MKIEHFDAECKCPYCKKNIVVWSYEPIIVNEITKNPPEKFKGIPYQ